jgi:hypothetical protein
VYAHAHICTPHLHASRARASHNLLLGFIWRSYLNGVLHSIEMRHDVTTLSFRLRKKIDNLLYKLGGKTSGNGRDPWALDSIRRFTLPRRSKGWMPLYTMVTFRPDIGYAVAKSKADRQATDSERSRVRCDEFLG